MKQGVLRSILEKHRGVCRTIATSKMEPLVALVSSFQLLTNSTKYAIVAATVTGVQDPPLEYYKGPSIKYIIKIFRKTNISNPLIRTRTCGYQGVRNVSFSEHFAYVVNGWPLTCSEICGGAQIK